MRSHNLLRFRVHCGASVIALFACGSAHANLITNGGFELPVVPVGSFISVPVGDSTTIPGWTVVGAAGFVSPISGAYTNSGISFPAQEGAQWLDMTGNVSNQATGVEQLVTTEAGVSYDLSFWIGNVVGGAFGTTSSVELFIDDVSFGIFTNSAGGATQAWEEFDLILTASDTSTAIRFINRDATNDNSNGLDNVSVVVSGTPPPPVPEPASLGLLALGLAAFGCATRQRQTHRR